MKRLLCVSLANTGLVVVYYSTDKHWDVISHLRLVEAPLKWVEVDSRHRRKARLLMINWVNNVTFDKRQHFWNTCFARVCERRASGEEREPKFTRTKRRKWKSSHEVSGFWMETKLWYRRCDSVNIFRYADECMHASVGQTRFTSFDFREYYSEQNSCRAFWLPLLVTLAQYLHNNGIIWELTKLFKSFERCRVSDWVTSAISTHHERVSHNTPHSNRIRNWAIENNSKSRFDKLLCEIFSVGKAVVIQSDCHLIFKLLEMISFRPIHHFALFPFL